VIASPYRPKPSPASKPFNPVSVTLAVTKKPLTCTKLRRACHTGLPPTAAARSLDQESGTPSRRSTAPAAASWPVGTPGQETLRAQPRTLSPSSRRVSGWAPSRMRSRAAGGRLVQRPALRAHPGLGGGPQAGGLLTIRLRHSKRLNRPGFCGGSDPWKGWGHVSQKVPG
jgi:hypothetical protein